MLPRRRRRGSSDGWVAEYASNGPLIGNSVSREASLVSFYSTCVGQSEAASGAKVLESRQLVMQAQLHTLQAEAEELREKEDELTLQLLNSTNALSAAEKARAELSDAAAQTKAEAQKQRERADSAVAEAEAARAAAVAARDEMQERTTA